jgi:intein/homing endonuclease
VISPVTNDIAYIANEFLSGKTQDFVDPVTFVESPWGLSIRLFPVQKFILKCASGDNIISNDDGVPVFLREYVSSGQHRVMTYDEVSGKIRWSLSSGVFAMGIKPVYRLTTKLTHRWVELTGDHLVKTPKGYSRLDSLKKGDWIVISEREPLALSHSLIEDWQAGFLGLMVGDGSCAGANIGLVIADGDRAIRTYYEDCVREFDPHLCFRERKQHGCVTLYAARQKGWDRNTKSIVGNFLLHHGLLGKNCHEKRVPVDIFRAALSAQKEFLRCLFATDGGFGIQGCGGIVITYTSCNRTLIDDVCFLLRRFGVRSTIVHLTNDTNFGKQNAWQIKINSVQEIRRFFSKVGVPIGWDFHYKEVWKIITSRKRTFCHADSLPSEIREFSKNVRQKFRDDGGTVPNTAPASVRAQTTGKLAMLALADWTGNIDARRIAESDICWDRVESAEPVGEKDVYDISVPTTHNFILNGIVIHNCLYGMKLDDVPGAIKVPDVTNEKILYEFSEKQFLEWLYAEKRCNTSITEGKTFRELILVAGRRSSKSTLAACISNYELYRLVKKGNPSAYFGFPDDSEIVILNVAPTDEQAGVVFEMIQRQATRCPYLRDRCLHQTMSYFDLRTDADLKLTGKARASLISLAGGCSSNALRGRNAIVIIMDEMAFFIDNGGRFSGDEVYKALSPSTASFGSDGKVLILSSPYAKYGKFWDRYNESFQEPDVSLMFKMYTPMVNPTIQSAILKAARRRDRISFIGEYGGEFSDSVTAWIDDENEFKKCISGRQPSPHGIPDVEYYAGIDLGFKNDGTAIVIVHDDGKRIVLDYADVWYSGSSDVWEFDNSIYGGCNKHSTAELIKMEWVVDELKELHRWFPIKKGVLDQHNGYALAELLCKSGLKQFEMEHLTDQKITDIFQLVKTMYAEQLLDLYNHPVLIPEMLSLEAERKSKERIIVRKPNRRGAHDDISDSFCRACWLCFQNRHGKPTNIVIGRGNSGSTQIRRDAPVQTPMSFALQKLKMHGEHPRVPFGRHRRLTGSYR